MEEKGGIAGTRVSIGFWRYPPIFSLLRRFTYGIIESHGFHAFIRAIVTIWSPEKGLYNQEKTMNKVVDVTCEEIETLQDMTPDEIETLRLRLGRKLIRLIDRLRLEVKMRQVSKKYVEAFRQRDADTRYYIRILNGDPPKGTEGERERIEKIVNAWVSNKQLSQDDVELLNEIGDTIRREIRPDFSVHTVQRSKPVQLQSPDRYASFAYVELYEAVVEWDGGKNEWARPRRCKACNKWFAPNPDERTPSEFCNESCAKRDARREYENVHREERNRKKRQKYREKVLSRYTKPP